MRVVEPFRIANELVRHQLLVRATERVTVPRCEVGKRHPESAADLGVQVMDLAREAVGRKPLAHRIRVEEGAIEAFGFGTKHTVEAEGTSGHELRAFR